MTGDNIQLLPCPFCGSTDLVIRPDKAEDDNDRIYAYHVSCKTCSARGRNLYPVCWCESEQQAVEAWNDRVIPATIPGDCDRVQLSTTALLHIHRELERISNIKNHISGLLTPVQRCKEEGLLTRRELKALERVIGFAFSYRQQLSEESQEDIGLADDVYHRLKVSLQQDSKGGKKE